MNAGTTAGTFNVVLVPVQYEADGSGRLPDTSQTQLDRYYEGMFSKYPVSDLSITVRSAPLVWNNTISPNGNGWGNLLNEILALRSQDNVADNVYYYGVFRPAPTIGNFCNGGCVAGLGPVPSAGDTYARGAIGLGFGNDGSANTFAHEIGHALGRGHAPCGTQGYNGYPYGNGSIGVWGYNILDGSLKSPNNNRDLMSYCSPEWISDHHFERFFTRIQYVNSRAPFASTAPTRWRTAIFDMDGLRWGQSVDLKSVPVSDTIEASIVGSAGQTLRQTTVYNYPLSHIAGSLLMIPEPTSGEVAIDIPGIGLLSL